MSLSAWTRWAERHERGIRRAASFVLAAGLLAFLLRGADGPSDPRLIASSRAPLPGFGQVAFHIMSADGQELSWCALLAATDAAREQGLMEQRNLRGYDGMLFRFDVPTSAEFYMYRTVVPLSIAWFGRDGRFVSKADMQPCLEKDPEACRTYRAARPYVYALETKLHGLGHLGVTRGAKLVVGGSC